MEVFEKNRHHLFDLISKSSKEGFAAAGKLDEHEDFLNNHLDKSIKSCHDDMLRFPDSVSYFDLVEGEVYYQLSGLWHNIFKVVSKQKSQYEGVPYYKVLNMKKHNCALNESGESLSSLPDVYEDTERELSNGMIYGRYQHIPDGDYSKVCDVCKYGYTVDNSGPYPVYRAKSA